MDNLDIYLYIILLVVYAVARLFKASGKRPTVKKTVGKRQEVQPAGAEPKKKRRPFSLEDILSEFEESFRDEPREIPVEEVDPEEEARNTTSAPESTSEDKASEPSPYFTYEGTSYDDLSTPAASPTDYSKFMRDARYSIGKTRKHSIIQKLKEPGGLRDAVLLSEILNRKYF